MRGFKNFLMRGDVIVVAVGLVIALAFSGLITAFTTAIVNPLIQSFSGGKVGLSVKIRSGNPKTLLDFGGLISAIINFVVFMAVVYFLIVIPYKAIQARRRQVVFGDPAPVETYRRACPATSRPPRPSASTAEPTSPPSRNRRWHRTGRRRWLPARPPASAAPRRLPWPKPAMTSPSITAAARRRRARPSPYARGGRRPDRPDPLKRVSDDPGPCARWPRPSSRPSAASTCWSTTPASPAKRTDQGSRRHGPQGLGPGLCRERPRPLPGDPRLRADAARERHGCVVNNREHRRPASGAAAPALFGEQGGRRVGSPRPWRWRSAPTSGSTPWRRAGWKATG